MRPLRRKMDRIDLKMLQLLQQRTKLSGQIGEMKRRHGAVIFVPERERELVARLTRLSHGLPPRRAVAALYREIFSSSRAAQGQAPIGLLRASASRVLPASRAHFGACDQFAPRQTWTQLAEDLQTGALALALLTGDDLLRALRTQRRQRDFLSRLTVSGDFSLVPEAKAAPAQRVLIVTPRGDEPPAKANRVLILIECKSALNAIKSLLHSMPDIPIHAEHLTRRIAPARVGPARAGLVPALLRLTLPKPIDRVLARRRLLAASTSSGLPVSILGIYPGTDDGG